MKIFLTICRYEWKLLTRNRIMLFVPIVFLAAACYAIHYGNTVISRQQDTLQYIRQQNALEQQELIKGLDADTTQPVGMAAYEKAAYPSKVRFFLNYYALNDPAPFARFSIGQRDVYPFYLQLNAQNLYLQLFKSEIANPRKLLAGNFDLSFVIIYLLPLLIITLTYNLLSDEQERGTLPVLKIQPIALHRLILYKWIFRLGIITALLLLVSLAAFQYSEVLSITDFGWWMLITLSYTICWFALLLLVNASKGSSAFNAISSLGLWVLFLVVIPAFINLYFTNEMQADATRLTDTIRRRQGLGESREEKIAVLQRFYRIYPQYKPVDTLAAARFLEFQSYSAYVTLMDAEAKPLVDAYYDNILKKHLQKAAFDLINPAVNTQNMLNMLGHTGLEEAFAFRQSITAFHWQICHFCFEPLFAGRMMNKKDFSRIPVFKPLPAVTATGAMFKGLGWLWMLTAIAAAIAYYRLK